jgi:hypothetical protein
MKKVKNTDRIGKYIISDIREHLGVAPDDQSKDDEINMMSPNEIFHAWCDWKGYLNSSEKFKRVISNIYGINIEGGLIYR